LEQNEAFGNFSHFDAVIVAWRREKANQRGERDLEESHSGGANKVERGSGGGT
jgi:hypothetical protein